MPERVTWTTRLLPPGVSIAVHAILLIVLVSVGSKIVATNTAPADDTPLAELDLSPQSTPQTPRPRRDTTPPTAQRPAPAHTPDASEQLLDASRRALTAPQTPDPLPAPRTEPSADLTSEPSGAPAPVSFAGARTTAAKSIVYAVDASGATATSFTYIRERLLQSIDRLSPTQRFQVILFRERNDTKHETAPIGDGKLTRATIANKRAVAEWISTIPPPDVPTPSTR